MKASNHSPSSKISDYVQGILVIEHSQVTTPFVLPLYANGSPTLLFQTAKGLIKGNANNLTLFGQTVLPDTLTMKENFTLIAYFLKPFSLYTLFGVSAHELTDNPIDLHLLAPTKTLSLQEQLLHAESTQEMLTLLDDYIFTLTTTAKADVQLIGYATARIAQSPFKDALVSVRNELGVTERTFQRIFEKDIGVSPNQYRRICQFNSAFWQLNKRKFHKLTEIAFENGYADQSHYIRAFKEFTNITPKDYLNFGNPP